MSELIRVGIVDSYNVENATARVVFEDLGLKSYDLPIIVKQTKNNKDYYIPSKGEMVVCIFLSTGVESGFVLGSIYNKKDLPPIANENKRHISFGDGTIIEYDISSHQLTISCVGSINISCNSVNINGNLTVSGTTITGGSINLNTHFHKESIGSVTGGPQ